MKLFLDTSNVARIQEWVATGIVDGVTTNPSNLSHEGGDATEKVLQICAAVAHGDVSIEITEKTPEAVYAQAQRIAALAPNAVVKIPCHVDYYPVIKKLVDEGIAVNITLVFSLLQALMMCKLGVKYISPFVGRLDDIDADGIQLVHDIRQMVDQYQFKTLILAASIRSVSHLHQAVAAGADAATLPASILAQAVSHPLTVNGMAQFDLDWQKLGVTEFPIVPKLGKKRSL